MNKIYRKLFNTKASSINEETKSVTFVISTNEEDRYGEVLDQKTWNFKSYLKNPLVLWGHDPDEPENVLGTASSLKIAEDGSNTTAILTFDSEINPKAELVFNQIRKGTLRTVSVGFINHSFEIDQDIPVLKDNELLEISVVPIPANSGAIALGMKSGEINRKDAKWLMDSMRREADLMEEQYNSFEASKEKSMTPEQANAIIEGISKLTESVAELKAENETLKTTIDELKPAAETEEEKQAREEQEAKDKAEADAKAEADKKAAEEEEAARKAAEDEKEDDPAKGGEDDQPGAGEADEFDEDAEITPEQQAEIDAELEAVAA
jgi:HK97 family phage prohead protease